MIDYDTNQDLIELRLKISKAKTIEQLEDAYQIILNQKMFPLDIGYIDLIEDYYSFRINNMRSYASEKRFKEFNETSYYVDEFRQLLQKLIPRSKSKHARLLSKELGKYDGERGK